MDNELRHDIDKYVESNRSAILRDIARLVAINSVEGEAEPNAPFGRGPREALDKGLEIARELGLDTVDCEGKIGYACLGGDSDRYLATITHLDVVPVGEGWTQDPFTMREREGYIIGRGVMDDKGPSVLCLYALKYLKDKGIALRYPVRALLGANEETGMKDVEYYLANYPAPLFCFSPDANFPLCNGEKGIYHGRKAEALESTERIKAVKEGELWHLTATGIGGHASLPEGTVNAIGVLVDYILDNGIAAAEEKRFYELVSMLNNDWTGAALNVAADDGLFEPLTIVGGVIGVEDGHVLQTIDSRYPTNMSGSKIARAIQRAAGDAAEITIERDAEPFYMALDNPAVQVCINAYNDVTGENAKPYTIGGGTYARDFPNAVSFGPEHPERPQPDFAGPIHGVDEAASIDFLMEALKVYILALIELEKLDF